MYQKCFIFCPRTAKIFCMRNIVLTISYLGTAYSGFQKQKNGISVQEILEKAIFDATGEMAKVTPSGRTDAGVHALGQVVNFLTNSTIPASKFYIPLNQLLPQDIRVMDSREALLSFNARKDAKQKTYVYRVYLGPVLSALEQDRVLHFPKKINISLIHSACKLVEGEHDFSAFVSTGSSSKTTTRTIYKCSAVLKDNYLTFEITGNGFLYDMVRILVGTILEIGQGKRSLDTFQILLDGGERKDAGKTAKACGLYLKNVVYK